MHMPLQLQQDLECCNSKMHGIMPGRPPIFESVSCHHLYIKQ